MAHRLMLALWMALVWPLQALANDLCPKNGPIRYAHYEFGLIYSKGIGGIDEDIRAELERRSGCKFAVDLRPRARIWADLEAGYVDMAGSGIQTPARDTFAWFAHYVLEDNQVLIGPWVPASVRSMADFLAQPELMFGGVRSFSYSPFYDVQVNELMQRGRIVLVGDTQSMYRMFDAGRFDAFIASQFLSRYYFKLLKLPVPPRIEDWDPAPATPSGLVLAKQRFSPEQARAWQQLVRKMLEDGTVLRIVARYLPPNEAQGAIYKLP